MLNVHAPHCPQDAAQFSRARLPRVSGLSQIPPSATSAQLSGSLKEGELKLLFNNPDAGLSVQSVAVQAEWSNRRRLFKAGSALLQPTYVANLGPSGKNPHRSSNLAPVET